MIPLHLACVCIALVGLDWTCRVGWMMRAWAFFFFFFGKLYLPHLPMGAHYRFLMRSGQFSFYFVECKSPLIDCWGLLLLPFLACSAPFSFFPRQTLHRQGAKAKGLSGIRKGRSKELWNTLNQSCLCHSFYVSCVNWPGVSLMLYVCDVRYTVCGLSRSYQVSPA